MSLSKEDLADIRTLIVEGTMEAINAVVTPRFDRIEARLDEHNNGFEEIDKRFDQIDKRFDQVDHHLAEHDRRFDQIDQRLDKLEGRVEALENDVKELYEMVPSKTQSRRGLTPEQRLRELYAGLQTLARELNIEL